MISYAGERFALRVDFSSNKFVLFRVTSWIVAFVAKNKDFHEATRNNTNQNASDVTLEVQPQECACSFLASLNYRQKISGTADAHKKCHAVPVGKIGSVYYCPIGVLPLTAVKAVVFAAPQAITPDSSDTKLRVPVAVRPDATRVDAVER